MQKLLLLTIFYVFYASTIFAQAWKTYPQTPVNSQLSFPIDEGWHEDEPIEWWYTNAHVIGQESGHEYSIMLSYFVYDSLSIDGFRILNIKDETTGEFKTGTVFLTFPILAKDHLEIKAKQLPFGDIEQWHSKTDTDGNLLPYQYRIESHGLAGAINFDLDAFKPPLIVADSGYLNLGANQYSYYYSQTGINISGKITFNNNTEPIIGVGWIDRQYGTFNPNEGAAYEWFSMQLSNGMDLNLWNLYTPEGSIPSSPNYKFLSIYLEEKASLTIGDIKLQRTKFGFSSLTNTCYANQWHLTSDSLDIDLVISIQSKDDEVLLPFNFLEGSTQVIGTIQGIDVTGKGFAELLQTYEHPSINITAPAEIANWNVEQPITWSLLNPNDGRPINYDLFVREENKSNFIKIAEGLVDTFYLWDYTKDDFPKGAYTFKVVGYSIDKTLIDSSSTEGSYDLFPLKITGLSIMPKLKVNPNPASTTLEVKSNINGSIQIFTIGGHKVFPSLNLKKGNTKVIDISTLREGSYLIIFHTNGKTISRKWVKIKR